MLHFVACALGTFLGLHFSVVVLIPMSCIGVALFGTFAALSGQSLSGALVMATTDLFLCQAGYMLGLTARAPLAQILHRLNFNQSKQV